MIKVKIDGNSKTIRSVYYMKLAIVKIAYGAKVIAEVISSCFGSGIWRSRNTWISNEFWKN